MHAYFLQLFGYDKWATIRLMEIFDEKPAINPRINELLSHMQSTQRIWLCRCQGEPDSVLRFQDRTPEMIWKEMRDCHNDWVSYILSLQPADFDRAIDYTSALGEPFTTKLKDIITQVTNHGTHHRGTIVALMKAEGFAPPNLDYISYVRQLPKS